MSVTYFKRFCMDIDLAGRDFSRWRVSRTYRFVPWDATLLEAHAETKYLCFRSEIDASVFPCLGDQAGCSRLMDEITNKPGFLPAATWLLEYVGAGPRKSEYCGTVQGIREEHGVGSIQNLGVTPHHRGRGLGRGLLLRALAGFQRVGLHRASLEVTSQNVDAIRLYERLGFRRSRTLYKAVEVACT